MLMPIAANRLLALEQLLLATSCLDPAMLRTALLNLQMQLNQTDATLAMTEMSLAQESSVQMITLLVPFLREADAFFRFANERIPQLQMLVQMAARQIGTGPAGSTFLFRCQNVFRISANLRQTDQRLTTLSQSLRQMEATYSTDAAGIAMAIQRRLTPPIIPIEQAEVPLPRRQTTAEQTALASVRLFRQEAAALLMLVQGVLEEIGPGDNLRVGGLFRM